MPSRPFTAAFNSSCEAGDYIDEGDEIVMIDGEAWHVTCAIDADLLNEIEDESKSSKPVQEGEVGDYFD
jgi:glycosylphosphatidylinositol transamidase (GPIT) subunit GPI8